MSASTENVPLANDCAEGKPRNVQGAKAAKLPLNLVLAIQREGNNGIAYHLPQK